MMKCARARRDTGATDDRRPLARLSRLSLSNKNNIIRSGARYAHSLCEIIGARNRASLKSPVYSRSLAGRNGDGQRL
jgi:hypothetical protein